MPNESILALPWPAWHTIDPYATGTDRQWLWDLSDRELVDLQKRHDAFFEAHRYGGGHVWKVSYEAHAASRELADFIRRIMARRFQEIVEKREQSLSIARLVRRSRKEQRIAA